MLKTQLLLSHRAETNAADHHSRTALMIAARHPFTAPIHLLLQYGADATLRDDQGRTALNYLDDLKAVLPASNLAAIRTEIQRRENQVDREK